MILGQHPKDLVLASIFWYWRHFNDASTKDSAPALTEGGVSGTELGSSFPMFAIVKTGGKQYRIGAGDQITVERIVGDVGSEVSLSEVLAIEDAGASTIVPSYRRQRVSSGKDRSATPWHQSHCLQEEEAQELSPQARPSAGTDRAAHSGDQRWRIKRDKARPATAAIVRDSAAGSRSTPARRSWRVISSCGNAAHESSGPQRRLGTRLHDLRQD